MVDPEFNGHETIYYSFQLTRIRYDPESLRIMPLALPCSKTPAICPSFAYVSVYSFSWWAISIIIFFHSILPRPTCHKNNEQSSLSSPAFWQWCHYFISDIYFSLSTKSIINLYKFPFHLPQKSWKKKKKKHITNSALLFTAETAQG